MYEGLESSLSSKKGSGERKSDEFGEITKASKGKIASRIVKYESVRVHITH